MIRRRLRYWLDDRRMERDARREHYTVTIEPDPSRLDAILDRLRKAGW